jgi:hypothetical protein
MANNNNNNHHPHEPPPYGKYDDEVIINNIFHELCRRDREDREEAGRPAAWNNLTELAEKLRAYDNRIDVAYIAEAGLLDKVHFIERDPANGNVRLSALGRENCGRRIHIPPSSSQA